IKSLQKLWIGQNALWKLPEHCLYRMHALKELSLKSNKLRELPQSLGLLCSLEVLYLQDNELEGLPASLEELKQLRMLWLEDNRLSSLPWTCTQPTSLPALQLVKLQKAVPYDAAPRLLETLEQPLLRPLEVLNEL
ncbi:Leucine-rich repeat and IQ domain-containing protein 4, partial [Durusdinium trenchii]